MVMFPLLYGIHATCEKNSELLHVKCGIFGKSLPGFKGKWLVSRVLVLLRVLGPGQEKDGNVMYHFYI
jgi:hypothetical protein